MTSPRNPQPGSRSAPVLDPQAGIATQDQPHQLDETELALTRGTGTAATGAAMAAAEAQPMLDPPGTPGAARQPAAVGAFQSLRVLALFSSNNPDNGWAFLEGVGWRRIATANDSAETSLSLLTMAARIQGTPASVRYENDNQIHEIYIW
jgi:hypothetical protein